MDRPESPKEEPVPTDGAGPSQDTPESTHVKDPEPVAKPVDEGPWPERFTTTLSAYLSAPSIEQLKQMYLEGPEPPFVSDGGWGARKPREEGDAEEAPEEPVKESTRGNRGRGRGRGGRGGRGGRAGKRPDTRKVVSEVRHIFRNPYETFGFPIISLSLQKP